jgi:hypothetical protein
MKQLGDFTQGEVGKTVYHQAAAAQGGKQNVVLIRLDASGLWWLVQWTSGAWAGQQNWVPFSLLSST